MSKLCKINGLTYFFILSAILTGMFKEFLILFGIIIFHELGHVVAIKMYHYEIIGIEIMPFGGVTKIKKDINSSINEEIIISISGILFQGILFVVTSFLYQNNIISREFYLLFNKYNFCIAIFNMLPIIPLDGANFFKAWLYKAFSFYKANVIIVFMSFIIWIVFMYVNYAWKLNNYFIGFFLVYKIIRYIKEYRYLENRFYLERYLKDYNFKKVKRIKKLRQMKKMYLHYAQLNRRIIGEKIILKKYFSQSK